MKAVKPHYEHMGQKPYESHYLYVETTIDHPVKDVWPHALNIGSWMTAHRLETITGESGRVGHLERVFPSSLGDDVKLPHYHLYGVANIIPFKYIGLEVFPEAGGSYGDARDWMSFDGILFVDLGGSTKVLFLMVDVQIGKRDDTERKRRQDEIDEAQGLLARYFENLRELVKRG
jgi:hypothetical protein